MYKSTRSLHPSSGRHFNGIHHLMVGDCLGAGSTDLLELGGIMKESLP